MVVLCVCVYVCMCVCVCVFVPTLAASVSVFFRNQRYSRVSLTRFLDFIDLLFKMCEKANMLELTVNDLCAPAVDGRMLLLLLQAAKDKLV